jgi:lipoprotein NlpD
MKSIVVWFGIATISLLLAACDDGSNFAPVMDLTANQPIPKTGQHQVKQGETLYEVAWRYGLDYRELAVRNQVRAPYKLHSGQTVYLKDKQTPSQPQAQSLIKPKVKLVTVESKPSLFHPEEEVAAREPNEKLSAWKWPTKGKVIIPFSVSHKGINITGVEGQAVLASASGKVVYAGHGLSGYGNLIIIKHNNLFLSAYAHNQRLLVKEGQWVRQGQKIAEMGRTGTDKVMLHFEIRKAGKAIDPGRLLNT